MTAQFRFGSVGVCLLLLVLVAANRPVAVADTPAVAALPLLAGHELDLNIWPTVGGFRVVLWNQAPTAHVRIVVFTLPAWPNIIALGAAALTALWWPRQREHFEQQRQR